MRDTIAAIAIVIVLLSVLVGIMVLTLRDHPSSPMELRFEAVEQRVLILEELNAN